jgi:hypothetical protein
MFLIERGAEVKFGTFWASVSPRPEDSAELLHTFTGLMTRLHALLGFVLLAALPGSGALPASVLACPGEIHPECGLTDGAHIYKSVNSTSYSECCSTCASDSGNCNAWVFVADSDVYSKGPGVCKLRHTMATCRPNKTDHISGSIKPQPTPPPSPVAPSPPPSPPVAGRKPHIVLLVVDDWGKWYAHAS